MSVLVDRRTFLAGAASLLAAPAAADELADFAMAVGLDRSSSMHMDEQLTQINGLAAAIRHHRFRDTIAAGRHGRGLLTVYLWNNKGIATVVPWQDLRSPADIERLAAAVETIKREWNYSGMTNVADAMLFGTERVRNAPVWSERLLVNVCGDGKENVGMPADVEAARMAAWNAGVVINGLSIGGDDVAAFYREQVSTPNGFSVHANSHDEFAEAFLRKFMGELV